MIPGNIDPVTGLQDYPLDDGSVTQLPPGLIDRSRIEAKNLNTPVVALVDRGPATAKPAGPPGAADPALFQLLQTGNTTPDPTIGKGTRYEGPVDPDVSQTAGHAATKYTGPIDPNIPQEKLLSGGGPEVGTSLPDVGPAPEYVPLDKFGSSKNPIRDAGKNLQGAATAGQAEQEEGARIAAGAEIRANELSRQTAIKRQAEEGRIQAQREQMAKEQATARASAEKEVSDKYAQASASAQWANRSTGQQIAGITAAIMGGFLSPYTDGRNRNLEMMMQAIDRDIAAAQVQAQAEEKKLGRLGETQAMDRNDLEIKRAAALDKVANGMEQELSGIKSDITRGNYIKQIGDLRQAAGSKIAGATQALTGMRQSELENARNRALQRQQMELEWAAKQQEAIAKAAQKIKDGQIPVGTGFQRKDGSNIVNNDTTAQKEVMTAGEQAQNAWGTMAVLKKIPPGNLRVPGTKDRAAFVSGMLRVTQYAAENLHARTDPDFVRVQKMMTGGDPESVFSVYSPEDIVKIMSNAQRLIEEDMSNKARAFDFDDKKGEHEARWVPRQPSPEFEKSLLSSTSVDDWSNPVVKPKERIQRVQAMVNAGGSSGSAELASDINSEAKALIQELDAGKLSPKEMLELRDTLAKAPPKARYAQIDDDPGVGPVDLLGVVTSKMTETARKERESRFKENEAKAKREERVNIGGRF